MTVPLRRGAEPDGGSEIERMNCITNEGRSETFIPMALEASMTKTVF